MGWKIICKRVTLDRSHPQHQLRRVYPHRVPENSAIRTKLYLLLSRENIFLLTFLGEVLSPSPFFGIITHSSNQARYSTAVREMTDMLLESYFLSSSVFYVFCVGPFSFSPPHLARCWPEKDARTSSQTLDISKLVSVRSKI